VISSHFTDMPNGQQQAYTIGLRPTANSRLIRLAYDQQAYAQRPTAGLV